jgi:hypothetical protein
MAQKPIMFDKDVVRKYCVELYGKINNSLYHHAKEMKDGMALISDLLKDKKHTYDKHLKMYDMLDQVIDKLDEKTSGDNSGNSGNSGNADDSSKSDLTKVILKDDTFLTYGSMSTIHDKYLRDLMNCIKNILVKPPDKKKFNTFFNDYNIESKLTSLIEFTNFNTTVTQKIDYIKKTYINSKIYTIITQFLEIVNVLCCFNLYEKFNAIYILLKDDTDKTSDIDKITKYININVFENISDIYEKNIRQKFIEWLYDNSDNLQDDLAQNINEMHKQIVTEDLIKHEINKPPPPP